MSNLESHQPSQSNQDYASVSSSQLPLVKSHENIHLPSSSTQETIKTEDSLYTPRILVQSKSSWINLTF